MSKQPVQWHKDCLKNMVAHLEQKQQRLREMSDYIDNLKSIIEFRKRQISEADKRGLREFDEERLLVNTRRVK